MYHVIFLTNLDRNFPLAQEAREARHLIWYADLDPSNPNLLSTLQAAITAHPGTRILTVKYSRPISNETFLRSDGNPTALDHALVRMKTKAWSRWIGQT